MTPTEHQRNYRKRRAAKDPAWAARERRRLNYWRETHPRPSRRRLGARRPPSDRDLLPHEVVAIREAYAAGGVTQRDLARDYLTSQAVVGCIVRGELYRDCGGPRTRRIRFSSESL